MKGMSPFLDHGSGNGSRIARESALGERLDLATEETNTS